jgi:hypothetical protein
MIEVQYLEEKFDHTSNQLVTSALGKETYEKVEEVLLPKASLQDPIFMTKKFIGHDEYRWEVSEVVVQPNQAGQPQKFDVKLRRKLQLNNKEYLTQLLSSSGMTAASILHRFSLVEVEYGHPLLVGKVNGDMRSNKRYPDTVQFGSMPKRRLAIVNRVMSLGRPVVQVIPISSKAPSPGDNTRVDVTNSLGNMVNYRVQSWAVCSMIETVSATRIIAPLASWNGGKGQGRDTGFKNKLVSADRLAVENALMYGVGQDQRVTDSESWKVARKTIAQKEQALLSLNNKINDLEGRLRNLEAYEQMAIDYAKALGRQPDDFMKEYVEVYGAAE